MITLIIMDGYGLSRKKKGNAIKLAGSDYLKKLKKFSVFSKLNASGNFVGLPKKQMGNSEAGHITIGMGRRIYQPLEKINQAIENKSFFSNPALLETINNAKKTGGALHIIGMVSDGGIHSHINHIKACIKMAHENNIPNIYLHAILDGRDTEITAGKTHLENIIQFAEKHNTEIKTICGRAWAMDRELHYERTEKYYNAIVFGKTQTTNNSAVEACKKSYDNKIFDEFIEPVYIGEKTEIKSGDSIIFCNIRKDRARQLIESLTDAKFDKFKTKPLKKLSICGLVKYGNFKIGVAFPDEETTNSLSQVLSENGKTQLHISETTKYPHVTYYFNGGKDIKHKNEEHCIIEGITDLNLAQYPKMKSFEIAETVLNKICEDKFDFIVVNFPNCDMIGHTANIEATKEAVSAVEKNAYSIALATILAGGTCIITADHGNAEELLEKDSSPKTSHTSNLVPFYLVNMHPENFKLKHRGELANIAPTILDLMDLSIPKEMSNSLVIKKNK